MKIVMQFLEQLFLVLHNIGFSSTPPPPTTVSVLFLSGIVCFDAKKRMFLATHTHTRVRLFCYFVILSLLLTCTIMIIRSSSPYWVLCVSCIAASAVECFLIQWNKDPIIAPL